MGMTREQMDRAINEHFGYEAADDVDGVMGTLTDEPEHEVIPSPVGALTDRAKMREYYEMLFSSITGESVDPLRRLYGEDFMDETMWHGHISDGRPFLCDGRSGLGELPAAPRLRVPQRRHQPRAGVVRPGGDPTAARCHRQLRTPGSQEARVIAAPAWRSASS
jgi:hypothetical protein